MAIAPKKQIFILTVSAILAAFSLASILNFTDPYESGIAVFAFFYISIFLLSFSVFTLTVFLVKRWLWPHIYLNDLSASFRQGLIIALFLTLLVILQLNGILFWWLEISIILFLIILEIFINLKE